jgi:hypothetical protein
MGERILSHYEGLEALLLTWPAKRRGASKLLTHATASPGGSANAVSNTSRVSWQHAVPLLALVCTH